MKSLRFDRGSMRKPVRLAAFGPAGSHAGHNSLVVLMMLALSGATHAQQQPVEALESITVVGQGASMRNAISQQRIADSIESVVHADGVAQLPDDNAAEALQRLPGVSVERDQGEGRFVSVRGLAPDLNAVNINGTLVPAPESDRRAVALDVLPSELIQSLSVVKSLTPDMDANSLGGTINVESLSAFDHDGFFATGTLEGGHDTNTGKNSPKVSGAISERFSVGGGEDNFGIAAAFSWQQRDFGSDNIETGGNWDFGDGAGRLEQTELRRYDIRRERSGLGLNFDWRPNASETYYLRTLVSRFKDTETRQASAVEFSDAQRPGERGDAEVKRELKHRTETQTINSFVLGGEKMIGLWTIAGQAGFSKAKEDLPGGIAGASFEGAFADMGYDNTRKPVPLGGAGYRDPGQYAFDEIEWQKQKATDTERNLRLDFSRDYMLGNYPAQLKFGGKLSRRVKENDEDIWKYDVSGTGLTLEQFAKRGIDSGLGNFGPGIDPDRVHSSMRGLDREWDEEESRINDFRMNEDINAAYVMQTLDMDRWRLIAGMRYEGTRFKADGTGYDADSGVFEKRSHRNNYNDWLPGLHARYLWGDDTQIRAAYTESVIRPTFGQLRPGFVRDGDEAEFGNPSLKPMRSRNFDLGIEHYFNDSGVASAYVFYKDIKNFMYDTDLAGTGEWSDFSEAKTTMNGGSASLYGLELAYSQKLSWLPSPWNGLLVGANVTFSKSRARIEGMSGGRMVRRSIDLPHQSGTVGNLMLGWENDKLSLRLSANYKSSYLDEVIDIADSSHDIHADSQTFVDFSARYSVNRNLQFYFEAQNLTNEVYYTYTGSRRYNAQYEKYGPSYKLGMTYVF